MMVAGVCRRLSSSVTSTHMQRNSPGAACDGGPVLLRPVRATPCYCLTSLLISPLAVLRALVDITHSRHLHAVIELDRRA